MFVVILFIEFGSHHVNFISLVNLVASRWLHLVETKACVMKHCGTSICLSSKSGRLKTISFANLDVYFISFLISFALLQPFKKWEQRRDRKSYYLLSTPSYWHVPRSWKTSTRMRFMYNIWMSECLYCVWMSFEIIW